MRKRLLLEILIGLILIGGVYLGWRRPWDREGEALKHLEQAEHYYHQDQHEKAIQELEQALKIYPALHQARIMLADIHAAHNRQKEAFALYDEGIRLYPNEPQLYYEKAMLLTSSPNQEEVVKLMKRYLELKPNDKQGLTMLGLTLETKLLRLKEAEAVWQKCVQLFPSDPDFKRRLERIRYKIAHPEVLKKPKPKYKRPKGKKPVRPIISPAMGL